MPSRADADRPGAPAAHPRPGRFDPARFGRPNPDDREPRPEVTDADLAATRAELDDLKRRTRRQAG